MAVSLMMMKIKKELRYIKDIYKASFIIERRTRINLKLWIKIIKNRYLILKTQCITQNALKDYTKAEE